MPKARGVAEEIIPIKIATVTSNDSVTLIYLGKRVEQLLNLKKKDRVILYVDKKRKRLICEKRPPVESVEEGRHKCHK